MVGDLTDRADRRGEGQAGTASTLNLRAWEYCRETWCCWTWTRTLVLLDVDSE